MVNIVTILDCIFQISFTLFVSNTIRDTKLNVFIPNYHRTHLEFNAKVESIKKIFIASQTTLIITVLKQRSRQIRLNPIQSTDEVSSERKSVGRGRLVGNLDEHPWVKMSKFRCAFSITFSCLLITYSQVKL